EWGCGQKVHGPSLGEMHKQAGLAACRPKATLLIAHMLADGELPPPRCAGCDAAETNVVDAAAICEQAPRRGGGDNSEQRMLAALLFGWWVLLLPNRDSGEGSDDRTVRVPLRLCPHCRAALTPPSSLSLLYCLAFLTFAGGLILFFLFAPAGFLLLLVGFGLLFPIFVLRGRTRSCIRRLWRSVPVYRQLLDEYPQTKLIVEK